MRRRPWGSKADSRQNASPIPPRQPSPGVVLVFPGRGQPNDTAGTTANTAVDQDDVAAKLHAAWAQHFAEHGADLNDPQVAAARELTLSFVESLADGLYKQGYCNEETRELFQALLWNGEKADARSGPATTQ
jgi:hypothetical protein